MEIIKMENMTMLRTETGKGSVLINHPFKASYGERSAPVICCSGLMIEDQTTPEQAEDLAAALMCAAQMAREQAVKVEG